MQANQVKTTKKGKQPLNEDERQNKDNLENEYDPQNEDKNLDDQKNYETLKKNETKYEDYLKIQENPKKDYHTEEDGPESLVTSLFLFYLHVLFPQTSTSLPLDSDMVFEWDSVGHNSMHRI